MASQKRDCLFRVIHSDHSEIQVINGAWSWIYLTVLSYFMSKYYTFTTNAETLEGFMLLVECRSPKQLNMNPLLELNE